MNKKLLIDYYKIHMPDRLKPYTEQALDILFIVYPGLELFDRKNIPVIQQIALKLHEDRKDKKTALPEFDFFPGSFIAAEKRIKHIFPEVIKIRKKLFGTQKAPFDFDKAIKWIRKEAKKERDEFYKIHQESQKDIQKLTDKIYDIINTLNEIQPWDYGIRYEFITIPIKADPLGPDTNEFITFPGTKLRKLANAIKWHSQNTNFSQFSLLMFILAGIKPMLSSYSINQEVSSYGMKKIELTLFRLFSQKEFIYLFKLVGELMPCRKKITRENLEVNKFIKDRGPIPLKGKMRFWKEALQEWNKIHDKKGQKYASTSGLRMAYSRLKKKIELY